MAFFCAPVLTYPKVRSAPVLENHHFRHPMTNFGSALLQVFWGRDRKWNFIGRRRRANGWLGCQRQLQSSSDWFCSLHHVSP
ncbi:hypothetical protein CU102_18590 [Phyllobacterium brassicacearum]|uniref:Uncharacterized protein n=1 Tax=Phyllobacterium brassicacearum TaxID=314235 RepID=A0A2P7BJ96_9HYPH|nr:hypothetical protein CU102_18590 [Phyllobacterium brassicacearum]